MHGSFKNMLVLIFLSFAMTLSGVYATWTFSEAPPLHQSTDVGVTFTEITFAPKETLHITSIQLISSNNASSGEISFTHPTYVASTITSRQTNCTVTYKVTVFNNTNVTYWYLGPSWTDSVASNHLFEVSNGISLITKDNYDDSGSTFNSNDWVPPYTTRDFYLTYRFGWNAIATNISTLISLDFGLKMDSVHDGFLAILNDTATANGYVYLDQVFNERYQEDGSTVIGNIGDDVAIFDRLFGGTPTINIDGKEVPVTIMIQRDNVDNRVTGDNYDGGGPTGCEYTLYLTVDPLDSPTGKALVYAISYSRGGEGATDQWYQLGQLYEGTAPLQNYNGTKDIAFNIDQWRATPNDYEFVDGYYYKAGYEQGDQYAKYKTIEEIMSANDQNFYNDIDNSQLLRKVYAVVYNNANTSKPGYEGLRTAFENAIPFYTVHNNGQEVKIKRKATRAELIPYIITIQNAYNYYNEVNP